mgnify:FL=1
MLGNRKNQSILATNMLFLIVALLLLTVGAKVQQRDLYSGLLITEYLIVLVPILTFIIIRGHSIKRVLRLNGISLSQIIYTIIIVILAYPIAVFLNYIGIIIISRFGKIIPNTVPLPTNLNEFLVSFLVIALSPGICEEVMFRGLIMNSYETLGRKKAIIYSAILFGMFHFNVQNLLGPIFLGLIFGIIVIKTNSILTGIIGHTVNNTIALVLGYGLNKLSDYEQSLKGMNITVSDMDALFYGLIPLAVLAFIAGILLILFIKRMPASKTLAQAFNNTYDGLFINIRRRTKMNKWDRIPIWIFILIFIGWNYIIFFL